MSTVTVTTKKPLQCLIISNYNLLGIVTTHKAKINLKLKLLKAVHEDNC